MVMLKEEIILKKLFVALDDRTLDLEKVGQHLTGLPTSYALESLEEAMQECALLLEQEEEDQRQLEEIEQREREERMEREAPSTMRDFWSDLGGLLDILVYVMPILFVFSPFLFLAGLSLAVLVQG
tara:strand:+ start:210 stop:587 length:378 start_codon:yes stop_codon:yes gene_type:complete